MANSKSSRLSEQRISQLRNSSVPNHVGSFPEQVQANSVLQTQQMHLLQTQRVLNQQAQARYTPYPQHRPSGFRWYPPSAVSPTARVAISNSPQTSYLPPKSLVDCSLCLEKLVSNQTVSLEIDPIKILPCCTQKVHQLCYNEYRAYGFSYCHICHRKLVLSLKFDDEEPTMEMINEISYMEDPMSVSLEAEKDEFGNYNVVSTISAPSFADKEVKHKRYGADLVLVVD
ncbi:hypothetical protein HDV06_003733, partial [Boothiomyces sp. JEL0866]